MGSKTDSDFEIECFKLVQKFLNVTDDPDVLQLEIMYNSGVRISIQKIKKWVPFLKAKVEVVE